MRLRDPGLAIAPVQEKRDGRRSRTRDADQEALTVGSDRVRPAGVRALPAGDVRFENRARLGKPEAPLARIDVESREAVIRRQIKKLMTGGAPIGSGIEPCKALSAGDDRRNGRGCLETCQPGVGRVIEPCVKLCLGRLSPNRRECQREIYAGRAILDPLQREHDIVRRRPPVDWILVEADTDDARERRRHAGGDPAAVGRDCQNGADQAGFGRGIERASAGGHLVEHCPERKESARASTALPSSCSGAMYWNVPTIVPSLPSTAACVSGHSGRRRHPRRSRREPEVEQLPGSRSRALA